MAERQLGNRLKELRTKAGITQAELAEMVKVSRKTINTVENGIFVPSTLLALSLAKALNTTVERLFFIE
ncbi:MAG TPA: helix-turn-helix domain-containing protein [Rhizomicrobium sp.]|nr:helix-turn-helix domain-containing protein [Rhizomicrobium sp.]